MVMRIKWKSYKPLIEGKEGTIISHDNNTLLIKLDNGVECKDLYWNVNALDDEATAYIKKVAETAIPLLSYFND